MNEEERAEQGGETDSRMREQQELIESLRAELAQMRTLPHVVGHTPGGETTDRRQFAKMTYSERVHLKNDNPKLYSELAD